LVFNSITATFDPFIFNSDVVYDAADQLTG